jgi:hypothetical protein
MKQSIFFILLTFSCLVGISKSATNWIEFNQIQLYSCPNPDYPKSKEFLIKNVTMPQTLTHGPYNQWCIKRNCEKPPNFETSFGPSSLSIRTPYVNNLAGFRIQMAWDFKKSARNNESSQWCVYYNQNDCYYAGTEFGFCSVYNFKKLEFYATPPFENIYNPPYQFYNKTSNTFYDIPEDCRADKRVKRKYESQLIEPVVGINYLNLTAIATDFGYRVSISFSRDNLQTIDIIAENELIDYPICNDDIRKYAGRITASIGTNFNRYGLHDSITYQKIEYLVE